MRRTVAGSDLLTVRDYGLVAMRGAGFAPGVVKRRGAHTKLDPALLNRTALALALRYTHDLEPMRPGRAALKA
ncbi:hypothetical protein BJM39_24470 [Salmonella enterica subsp. enterica serovar Javiana]|nr:hypothetical protein BJM39_24470 [Salmonella enterica subsp. enterica serovar Javiana]